MNEQMTCPRCHGAGKVDGTLRERLKMLREERGETLEQVAAVIDMAPTNLGYIEKGKIKNPSVNCIIALAKHYGMSMDDLVGLPSPAKKPKP